MYLICVHFVCYWVLIYHSYWLFINMRLLYNEHRVLKMSNMHNARTLKILRWKISIERELHDEEFVVLMSLQSSCWYTECYISHVQFRLYIHCIENWLDILDMVYKEKIHVHFMPSCPIIVYLPKLNLCKISRRWKNAPSKEMRQKKITRRYNSTYTFCAQQMIAVS